ncbi:MAG: DUF4178 domain-containing protein [Ekhidna sp.]|nr:DUF4178 domain-containing protein [Ekhidna sp.]
MFGFFKKKKEPAYDVTNLGLDDLDIGFIFDYDLKSWVINEMYEYDWGSNNFSHEYKVDSGEEIAFLSVEDSSDLVITLTKSIKIKKIDEDFAQIVGDTKKAPAQLHYEGITYHLASDSAGYFRDCGKKEEEWEELFSWEYFDENETKIISITQWDEHTFDAFGGIVLEPHQISNIIPGGS